MAQQEPSIVDLIRTAVYDAQQLVRSEVALAKAELRDEGRRLGTGIALLGTAAMAGLVTVLLLTSTVAWALAAAFAWPVWVGYAVVTAIMLATAVMLGLLGRRRLASGRHMPRTVESLKENSEWIRARTS